MEPIFSIIDNQKEHLNHLVEIRSLMEKSSRFISLSGLSGVAAGIFALIGLGITYLYLEIIPFTGERFHYINPFNYTKWGIQLIPFFLLNAGAVFSLAISFGIYFTTKKAKKKGQKIWDKVTLRLLISLSIPLVTGGLVCLAMIQHGLYTLIAPCTLIFYGLALVNAGKYTLNDIYYLGLCEILLGLLGLCYIGYGLELWGIGFGILHILYGTLMYFKYERVNSSGT